MGNYSGIVLVMQYNGQRCPKMLLPWYVKNKKHGKISAILLVIQYNNVKGVKNLLNNNKHTF